MRKLYSFLLALLATFGAAAQLTLVQGTPPTYMPTLSGGVYTLTGESPYYGGQANGVWQQTPISLTAPFKVCANLNFGRFSASNPDPLNPNGNANNGVDFGTGADGIAFVLSPNAYVGLTGEEMGYGSTTLTNPPVYTSINSFAVEFDTWQNNAGGGNRNLGDMANDHMAFMRKGQTSHTDPLNTLVPAVSLGEIEDNMWHAVVIQWDPATGMSVTFDGGAPMTMSAAAVLASFAPGTTSVRWGFNAGTGLGTNMQKVEIVTCPAPPADCGPGRTQTQGGWGSVAHGNNPGSYRDAHFAAAFPSGVTVGLLGAGTNYSVTWTTSAAVEAYLPAGGPSAKLTMDYANNPTTNQLKNNAVAQVLALSLSVGFDAADPNYSPSGTALGDMEIVSGPFAGWTVSAFLAEANKVLGNGTSSYTVAQIHATAAAINENYVDGTMDNGYLECPDQGGRPAPVGQQIEQPEISYTVAASVYPNPNRGQFQLNLSKADAKAQILVVNSKGVVVERRNAQNLQNFSFDLKKYGVGVYLVKVVSGNDIKSTKVIVQD